MDLQRYIRSTRLDNLAFADQTNQKKKKKHSKIMMMIKKR